jgi:CNT family concentrative nucleoside transporter
MSDLLLRLQGILGVFVMLGLAFALSENRRRFPLRVVLWGVALQLLFVLVVLRTLPGQVFFTWAKDAFTQLIGFTARPIEFLFGKGDVGLAFRMLPVIIFFGALMSILYHLGLMQQVVAAMAWVMRRCLRTSGAESLAAAANVFVGMVEAALMIRPYVAGLTRSELMAVMVSGLATIAGSVMAFYASLGVDAGHLLCASVISAPAALVIAKILVPETEQPKTAGVAQACPERSRTVACERRTRNVIDAAATGASDGLTLALTVAAMLIAFLALLEMVNYLLGQAHFGVAAVTGWDGFPQSLQAFFGWLFRPLAWTMGVPWSEAGHVGSLMGIKISANEAVAYQELTRLMKDGALSPRAQTIATYALCGFANFGSLGIMVGGIGSMAPERRGDLSRLGLRALAGGALASFLTACVAGILL